MRWSWTMALALACGPGRREVIDTAVSVCFDAPIGLPGTLSATVTAYGGENPPHDGSCLLAPEGDGLRLTTSFFVDRDRTPFADFSILTIGTASCEQEVDGADPALVVFLESELLVPADGGTHCFQQEGEDRQFVPAAPGAP
jgi:hypothetical protein